jgi:hypothetical protein
MWRGFLTRVQEPLGGPQSPDHVLATCAQPRTVFQEASSEVSKMSGTCSSLPQNEKQFTTFS